MCCTAEFLTLMNCKVSVAAHYRAHLYGAVLPFALGIFNLHFRGKCLTSDSIGFFIDYIVIIPVFFKVHCHACAGRASADYTDALILVFHKKNLPLLKIRYGFFIHNTVSVKSLTI